MQTTDLSVHPDRDSGLDGNMEFFKRFPVIALALLFSFSGTAISPAAATDAGSPFRDERCPFSARFANGLTPKLGSAPNATSAETSATGYRFSYACIANPNAVPAAPLEGQALHDRLSGLAQSLGMRGAKVTVPASPARSCGLIEGQTDAGGKTIKTRTEFCYGPRAYFIVETSSDGALASEAAVQSVLDSIRAN